MFEEYNQTVKTAKELSREEFESFEFQPKKKVREMFEKLMNSANEEEDEEDEDEEEQEEHMEDDNRKDGKMTAKKRKAAPTKKTNTNNNTTNALLRMREISATELACKLNSKHKDAEEKPTSSERILSQLLSTASTKNKSVVEKNPAAVPAKKKKKTKDGKEGEPAAGGKEEEEEEEEEEEIDERLKLARGAIKAAKASRKVHKIKDHEGLKAVIEKRDFAGMVMEVEKTYKEGSKEAKAAEEKENLKGQKMSGLDALLAKIEKSKKMSVLDKTKMDWKKVKDSNEEIDEELEMHRKSKNTYTEQQSFLQQAEYREYEKERDARLAANARRGQGI